MVSREFFRFNTTNTISAETDDASIVDRAVGMVRPLRAFALTVDPASELFRLNHARGVPTDVDPELATFIDTALAYCRATDGLFDITMGSATQLWDSSGKRSPTPTIWLQRCATWTTERCRDGLDRDAVRPAGLR